jgi:hypothetical protein
MQEVVSGSDLVADDVKIESSVIKRTSPDEFPERAKWKIQMLYLHEGRWIGICRIDNYLHEGQTGSYIHTYGNETVKRHEVDFNNAYKLALIIGARILRERFNRHLDF